MKLRASTSLRSGMTLIEIMIASGLLSMLALMSLTAIQASGTQAHFTSNRADIFRRTNTVMTRLERELEGGSYQDKDNAVGTFNTGARTVTFAVPGPAVTTTDAIQFTEVTGYDTTSTVANPNGVALTTGQPIIYAFERLEAVGVDNDNDGFPGEYQLVRINTVTNAEVVIQANILGQGQPGLTSGAIANPTFILDGTNTSELTITFSLGAVIGFSGGVRQITATTVTRSLSLRNLQ
jgi:prepilin-type N-terminal cleavage/methylation domain-containing protein